MSGLLYCNITIMHLFLPKNCRMCMGMRYGHAQVKAAIMTIVRDFKINVSPKQLPVVPDPTSFLWHAKDGVFLNFTLRTQE